MTDAIVLIEDTLSQDLRQRFFTRCRELKLDAAYTDRQWRIWADDSNVMVYSARKGEEIVGWLLFNRSSSTIERLVSNRDENESDVEFAIMDALLFKESLVSARVLRQDAVTYQKLVAYGFRPTRQFNKHGFQYVGLELSTSVYFQKIGKSTPAAAYPHTERVAVQKVDEPVSHDEVSTSLKKILDALGGIERFVKTGQNVVIKPNVVADHGMRNGVYQGGVVTDIGLLQVLLGMLLPVAGSITIAEGSSINRAETMQLFKLYGYDKLQELDPEKIRLVDLHRDPLVEKRVPRGKRMMSRKIPVTFEKADVIINMPVMKTHFAALASLSIKNLQGALPPLEKYMTHFFGLWQNLVNIHHLVKPSLIILDGLTAQEGFGPVYGTPKKMNLILGGTNAVAVDTVAMHIMGLDPHRSPPVKMAYMQGMGPMEPEKITVVGSAVDDVKEPFKEAEIDLSGGKRFAVHADQACSGCKGYLHYVLHKLRRPDPADPGRLLIDRPFEKKVNIFLGPVTAVAPNPEETNVFMGICQQHHAENGTHLAGCPPHAEVIMKGIFSLFPDVKRPQYADQSAEDKLETMLREVLAGDYVDG